MKDEDEKLEWHTVNRDGKRVGKRISSKTDESARQRNYEKNIRISEKVRTFRRIYPCAILIMFDYLILLE